MLVPDSDDDPVDDHDFDDGFIDDEDALAAWDEADAALHKTMTEVVDLVDDEDEDEDDVIVAGPSSTQLQRRAKAARRTGAVAGGEGAVNSARRPGPPEDGSSPPRGSIYISTLSRAYKEGCTSSLPSLLSRFCSQRKR